MVSKACLVGAYQTKLEQIARHEALELVVVVPPAWHDPAGKVALERTHTKGYELVVEPIRFNGQFHLHYYPRLKERLESFRPHILHMDEEPYNLATWLAVRQARAIGAKSLFFSWQNIMRQYPVPFRWMEKQVLESVDFAIMGNKAAADVWRVKGYRGPYRIIPQFGVDPEVFRPPVDPDPARPFTMGITARRLVPEKGVDLLLQAAARLPGSWQIRIAGDGPAQPALEQLVADLGITDRVSFEGIIPSARMPAFLQQLDVVVVPSRTLPNWKEQFGRVLIEAMACETAVIGSDSGEIPHVVDGSGLIFPEDDIDALYVLLLRLMEDPAQRVALGGAGRKRVLSNYTQDRVALSTVEVYRAMADGAGA